MVVPIVGLKEWNALSSVQALEMFPRSSPTTDKFNGIVGVVAPSNSKLKGM